MLLQAEVILVMAKRLVLNSLLVAVSLIIFIIEGLIPPLAPIPGIKIGLANIITLFAIYRVGNRDAFMILMVRIFIASMFAGQMMMLFYSLAGGIFCWVAMVAAKKWLDDSKLWATSVIGAVFHNLGQIIVAVIVMQTKEIFFYFPFLLVSGMIAGAFTGLCCRLLVKHFDKIQVYI